MTGNEGLIGKAESSDLLNLKYANRHGLTAGAAGSGETVAPRILAGDFGRR